MALYYDYKIRGNEVTVKISGHQIIVTDWAKNGAFECQDSEFLSNRSIGNIVRQHDTRGLEIWSRTNHVSPGDTLPNRRTHVYTRKHN